jgi:hypothetical protein
MIQNKTPKYLSAPGCSTCVEITQDSIWLLQPGKVGKP